MFQLSNTKDTLDLFFDGNIPQVSLQYITKVLLNAELKKEEQSGNWLIRPLDEEKMKYAATDAFYTLKCYFRIKDGLEYVIICVFKIPNFSTYSKEQWIDLKKAIYKIGEPMKVVQTNAFSLFKKKETFEEIVDHLQSVMEEIKPMIARKAEENLIVLEAPFLGFRGILKRCGFQTWYNFSFVSFTVSLSKCGNFLGIIVMPIQSQIKLQKI